MLVFACRHERAMPDLDKPRVISEIKKKNKNGRRDFQRKPKIAGELEWAVNGAWELRHVEVTGGCLVVYGVSTRPDLRLPLRHLSLQPANQPRTFSLVHERQSLATLQAGTDEEYERWVKTLAVELMRQTPLESVRFLDILGITATIATARGYEDDTGCIRRGPSKNNDVSFRNSRKDCLRREDCHPQDDTRLKDFITNYERGRTKQRVWVNNFVSECVEKRPVRAQSSDPVHKMSDSESELEDADEKEMMALLRRCQQVDSYVPVRDKRRLFESLCQRGRRLAQSSDNLCSAAGIAEVKLRRRKRARSLHDLSRSNVAVREICQYFETRVQLEQDVTPHQAVVRLHQQ